MLLCAAQPLPSRPESARRPAARAAGRFAAPSIVREVIGGAGAALDAGSRAAFEPRFGHDFARVRVHADARAAESAGAVGARAYTVGEHVVFGAGEHAPGSAAGRRLMAHELAHVVQQRAVGALPARLEVGERGAAVERLADAAAERAASGRSAGAVGSDPHPAVRRAPPPEAGADAEAPAARELVDRNWAGATLSESDRQGLAQYLFQDLGEPAGAATGNVQGAKFLLHDTSGASSRSTLETEAKDARGPMGSGPHAFVPATGLAILQRPDFFDARRPTTTEWEKGSDVTWGKGSDILTEEKKRDAGFRAVWKVTSGPQRDGALNRALNGLTLTSEEISKEQAAARKQLAATSGKVFSTATWATDEICAEVGRAGAAAVAEKGKEADLTAACAAVAPVLQARKRRLESTVSVELVQVGSKKDAKNKNTCDPDNPDNLPLPDPPYSDAQYSNTVLLYLRAAVMAGRFPEVTTHFVVDAFAGGHCDPRCFDLTRFYRNIATTLAPLGHGPKSTYGVAPGYGRKSGTDTVWWHDKTCHRAPP